MYSNYGDKDFFERGVLVEVDDHSDTEYNILYCNPYSDIEDCYQFGDCTVDISDSWIDKEAVMSFIGMTDDEFNPVMFAIGCIDYYGISNLASSYAYEMLHMTKKEICEILKYREISPENLDIEW